jgi:hypothetical protein
MQGRSERALCLIAVGVFEGLLHRFERRDGSQFVVAECDAVHCGLVLVEPMGTLADMLTSSTFFSQGSKEEVEARREVVSYILYLRNPLPGSECSYVVGHRGVDCHSNF